MARRTGRHRHPPSPRPLRLRSRRPSESSCPGPHGARVAQSNPARAGARRGDAVAALSHRPWSIMTTPSQHFRTASDGFLARINAVQPGQWQNPTPCPAWTVRDVTVHVINEQRRTLSTVRQRDPQPIHGVAVANMGQLPTTASGADLTAAWSQIGDELAATIDDPSCLDVKIPTPM